LKCVGSQDIVLGSIMGLVFGGLYYMLIYVAHPEWTYFSETASDKQVCKRIGTTKFKCTIRKS